MSPGLPILLLLIPVTNLQSNLKGLNVTNIEVLEGEKADLPCDISTPRSSDSVRLILWFKEDEGKPIYSVEVPPRLNLASLPPQSFWSSSDHFSSRAEFRAGKLSVSSLSSKESGTYRCRVDFAEAQTRSTFINLTVVEPVERVVLTDETGRERVSFVGPYLEGQTLALTCAAFKGVPAPWVEWWQNMEKMNTTTRSAENRVSSTLTLSNLTRADLHSQLTCRVNNNNISAPTIIPVHIDMNLSPTGVSLEGWEKEMVVGRVYSVVCTVLGSRPPPLITWYFNADRLEGTHDSHTVARSELAYSTGIQSVSRSELQYSAGVQSIARSELQYSPGVQSIARSELQYSPGVQSVGGVLRCKAVNPAVPGSKHMTTDLALNVSYAPHVSIGLGKGISPNTVYEGGDVYFDCKVGAVPPSNRIAWIHNGVELRQDVEHGVLFTNFSLVLQKITRERSGSYACEAGNRIGRGQSQEMVLDVKYVPVCKVPQPQIYGVSKKELVTVICEVEANPADVEFRWTFNNTAELIRVPPARPDNNLSSSVLSYTPMTTMDYGTLMCLAQNQVGSQKEPCVFHIIMAVTPDPVENCTVINKSSDSFHLQCTPGFDGGMNQTFHIIVKERESSSIQYDNSNLDKPDVVMKELRAGAAYTATVTSYNKKGTSLANHIHIETMQQPDPQLVEEKLEVAEEDAVTWQVGAGIMVGLLVSLLSVSGAILLIRRRCMSRGHGLGGGEGGDTKLILETPEPYLHDLSSSSCSNILISSIPARSGAPGSLESPAELLDLGLCSSRSLEPEELLSTAPFRRKGILKKNSDCDIAAGDSAEPLLQHPCTYQDGWRLERPGLHTEDKTNREISNLPVRTEKDGLLSIQTNHSAGPVCSSQYSSERSSLQGSDVISPYPLEISISSQLSLDTAACVHSLKRRKQESMV